MTRPDPILRAILAQLGSARRALARLGIEGTDADELTQNALLVTYRAARSDRMRWQEPRAVRGYLRTVARRLGWRYQRKRGRFTAFEEHHEPEIQSSEEALLARGLLRTLRESTTPERWRAVRSFALGTSVKEIAARERVPMGTIYTRLRLARLDFEAALSREEAITEGPIVVRFWKRG